MFAEWIVHGKPSALGVASGAVAGLVAITPASGYVGPEGALVIGIACGLGCYFAVVKVKRAFGYDDSLDAFGVHGIGGMIGALLTGVFADASFGGIGLAEGVEHRRTGRQAGHRRAGHSRLLRHRELHHPEDHRRSDRPARRTKKTKKSGSTSRCTTNRATTSPDPSL